MPFQLPEIEENQEGWGPTSAPAHLKDVPFMPYSKGDRLGRIADFGQQAGRNLFAGERGGGRRPGRRAPGPWAWRLGPARR